MLSRPFRLVKEKDFAQVMRKGRAFKLPEGQVKALANNFSWNRFGVVVSNKISKKATVRNLLKRRVRSIIREFNPKLKSGFDVVFVAYPPITQKNFQQIRQILWQALERLSLVK